jgi:bifunctional non-homologous end joining protein LigD
VIVWENRTYNLEESSENVKNRFKEDLESGHLDFILKGNKLKGKFALVKSRGKRQNTRLLIKIKDEFAEEDDILGQDKSVISNDTFEKLVTQ